MKIDLAFWPLGGGILALLAALLFWMDVVKKDRGTARMQELSKAIRAGARSFLIHEYIYTSVLIILVFVLFTTAGFIHATSVMNWRTGIAFLTGALCTGLAGYVGMAIATRANSRAAEAACQEGLSGALQVAISGGGVMGLGAVGLSLIGLSLIVLIFHARLPIISAYALGASLVALMVRLSGGIYTKGADIGADMIAKAEPGFSEDDARNAAAIADKVGDNVGDVMGLGSNLIESFVEAMIASMVIAMTLKFKAPQIRSEMIMLPLMIASLGGVATIVAIAYLRLFVRSHPLQGLAKGTIIAGLLTILGTWLLVDKLGAGHLEEIKSQAYAKSGIFESLVTGFVAGLIICFFSDYYTSFRYRVTRRIAERSQFGVALTVLEGMSVGMRSCVIPGLALAGSIVLAYQQSGLYGIALASFGMLVTIGMMILMGTYGPIIDNAGGIAEMTHQERSVRDIFHNLNLVGNTTASVSKGFATFSASMVSLALLAAYVRTAEISLSSLALNNPKFLAGLLVGGMFPYYFSSLLFRAVGVSATAMIDEVRRQFRELPGIREGQVKPDYARCVELAIDKAFKAMLLPAAMAIVLPLAVGFGLGRDMLAGVLIGSLLCGLMLGFQMVNSGCALDNAKKYIEEGFYGGAGSEAHKAAAMGDTVGDCFKDTIGPSLNILIKLMCVIALVIAPLL